MRDYQVDGMYTEIAPDVYEIIVRSDADANWRVFLIDGESPTLVDAGFDDTVAAIGEAVTDLDITPERIVITHGDPDHVGGLTGLVERFSLTTWVPEGVSVDLPVSHRFSDGDSVGQFTGVHVPGHTAAHHALVDEDRGIAVLGDAVFGSDTRGLPPGYFVLPPAAYSADLSQADESLSRLLEYEFDIGLVYHGSSVTEAADERLAQFVNFAPKP